MPQPAKPAIPRIIRRATHRPDRHWLYAYWDRDGYLLYVGISSDAASRAYVHRANQTWWRFVATGTAWHWPVDKAAQLEARLIRNCMPLFNVRLSIVGNLAAIEYCAHREAWDIVDDLLDLITYSCHSADRLTELSPDLATASRRH